MQPTTKYRNPDEASAQWLWDCLVEWHSTDSELVRSYLATWLAHGIEPLAERYPTEAIQDVLLQLLKFPITTVRLSAIQACLVHANSQSLRDTLQKMTLLESTAEGRALAKSILRAMKFYFSVDGIHYRSWETPEMRYARFGGTQGAWISSWLNEPW